MITLNTIVYEKNFKEILSKDSWIFSFKSKLITKRSLTINNVQSKKEFLERVEEMKKLFDFDLIWVEENSELVKRKFGLAMDQNTIGYHYTIPYFVMLDNIKTDYVLNVAGDSVQDIYIDDNFLEDSLEELESNPLCSSTMVSWVKDNRTMENGKTVGQHEYDELVKLKGVDNPEKFTYTTGFTDQFFLTRAENLRRNNYNLDPIYSESYKGPSYGGNCFEKRIVGIQVYTGTYNCVYKGPNYYIHDKRYY